MLLTVLSLLGNKNIQLKSWHWMKMLCAIIAGHHQSFIWLATIKGIQGNTATKITASLINSLCAVSMWSAKSWLFYCTIDFSWTSFMVAEFHVNTSLQWRHNGRDSVSNHQPHDCLLNGLFRRRSKKTSKLRVTGLCVGNSPGTGEFPAQMASYAKNVSIWSRHLILGSMVSH